MQEAEEKQDGDQREIEHIFFWGIPRKWAELVFKIASLIFLGFAGWVIWDEFLKGDRLIDTISAIAIKLAAFSITEAATAAALCHGVDFIMFWTTRLKAQLDKRDKKAEARGIQIGETRKQVEVDREWNEWFQRKTAAEKAGEPFDEPSPAEKRCAPENLSGEDEDNRISRQNSLVNSVSQVERDL